MVAQLKSPRVSPSEGKPSESSKSISYLVEGTIQVFTCSHRSFFTNVMAQALRISGQGSPALVVQFLKGGIEQGLDHPVQLCQNLDWIRCNLPRCIDTPHLDTDEINALMELWRHTRSTVAEGRYALVVLDELSLAIKFGLISEAEVLEFLQSRPRHVDIILTGPDMPESFLELADQVTELRRSY